MNARRLAAVGVLIVWAAVVGQVLDRPAPPPAACPATYRHPLEVRP